MALAAPALIAALLAGPAAVSSAASPRVCNEPSYPGDGYFTSLTVKGVRCATGARLAFAYYRCRVRAGGRKGRCTKPVLGFHCTETRNVIPTEIDARVTCTRPGERVVHTYQQNT
jgi:hypothetical protein